MYQAPFSELKGATHWGVIIRGQMLQYDVAAKKFTYKGKDVSAEPVNGRMKLEILVDRTSMELFVNDGKISASFSFLPQAWDAPIEFYAHNGSVRFNPLIVRELNSAWDF